MIACVAVSLSATQSWDEKAGVGKGAIVRRTSCEQMGAIVSWTGLRVVCIDDSEDEEGRVDRFAGLENFILKYLSVDEFFMD